MRRAALAGALIVLAGCGGGATTQSRDEPRPTTPVPVPDAKPSYNGPFGAKLLRATALRARPGGKVLARVRRRTEFGSMQILSVARRRHGWLAVRSAQLPNGRIGWIRARSAHLLRESWTLEIDLSQRRLVARESGRRAFAIPVAVGTPASPTPTGRFGVTDRLQMVGGDTYGCCALALTGHQPSIPQGWGGGDRIAIHGTNAPASVGTPASHGCVRASAEGMRKLMDVVPLGATVRIHA